MIGKQSPKVIVLSFSTIAQDARVLRQIKYLSKHFSISVIGYGELEITPGNDVIMHTLNLSADKNWLRKLRTLALLPLGRIWPGWAYEAWYWGRANHIQAWKVLQNDQARLIHANDWNTLPLAVRAADRSGAKVVLDLHEYAPRQSEENLRWRLFVGPMIDYFLRKYAHRAHAWLTVNDSIAEEYSREYGFRPAPLLNAPELIPASTIRLTSPAKIHLVHHGAALRDRRLELMVETVGFLDSRFDLHFYLLQSNQDYLNELKNLAQKVAPGRIHFHDPLKPAEILPTICQYDLGFYLLPPTNFNNSLALPNKFFDFISAGLGVCIGPSKEMAHLAQKYGFGIVSRSFNPQEVAGLLNILSAEEIDEMKQKAVQASKVLNAEVEMKKMNEIYDRLIEETKEGR